LLRGFLVYFESELLKRAHKNFDFRNGRFAELLLSKASVLIILCFSIGNYFLAAAQGFFRSLPSAIFLFSSITNSLVNFVKDFSNWTLLSPTLGSHSASYCHQPYCNHCSGTGTLQLIFLEIKGGMICNRKTGKGLLGNVKYLIQWRLQIVPPNCERRLSLRLMGWANLFRPHRITCSNHFLKEHMNAFHHEYPVRICLKRPCINYQLEGQDYTISTAMGWKSIRPPMATFFRT
jgi:hypothetical protein